VKKLFFFPDTHIPFQDQRALDLAMKARQYFKPDHTFILGDWCDFYSVSAHSKDPRRVNDLETEVDACQTVLSDIGGLSDSKHFICGNHEQRLERYLSDKAPALFGLVKIPRLLDLESKGWSYTPYGRAYRIGRLSVTHDCGNAGPFADQKSRDTFQGNVVIGHTHRMGVSYKGNAKGVGHVGAMFGWLGDVNHIDYMHRVKALEWQLGFGIGFLENDGTVRLQPCPIVNYKAEVMGRLLKG